MEVGTMPLVKQVTAIGNSLGVIIDRPVLKQVDLSEKSEVEVSVENGAIVLRPHRYATEGDFQRAKAQVIKGRRRLLAKLAKR
jgi:antitoxin MazE